MKLFFRKYGSGDPVIILHGIFGISDNWVTIGKRIAEKFTVYILDQRNHGRSPHSPTFNYFALMDDLNEFIEDHGLENPILIGHSMGGKVAMNFVLENPGLVQKLIVVDISPKSYPARKTHIDMISAMLSVDFDIVTTRGEVDELLQISVPNPRIRLFMLKNLQRINRSRLGWKINIASISQNIDNIFTGLEVSGHYDEPTLFIRGGDSDYIVDEDIPRIMELFPNAEIAVIPGASHWVHADEPDYLCSVFSRFLAKDCVYDAGEQA